MTRLTAVIGNPREGSRTHRLTATVVDKLASAVGAETEVVDLAALAPVLLDPYGEQATRAREQVAGSDLVVLATPVYKATYTGLLKLFLDGYGTDGLAGTTAVGLIVSAAPHHLLSTDIHLRSLLVELGASVPTRSLQVLESQLEEPEAVLEAWLAAHVATLRRALAPVAEEVPA
ncbi:NADPH-dependent FMN reductase [Pseudactinotalea sp.]|uniref:NADPH-dependent FMN reductase n=1 Tax=Pseudactinotalea sp. TaxID=1926260 RepID=UPI003B39FDAD